MIGGTKAIILLLCIALLVSCSEQAELQQKYESAETSFLPNKTSLNALIPNKSILPNKTPESNNTPLNKALLEMFESSARQNAELQAKIHPELKKAAKERPKVKTLFTAPTRQDYLRLKEKLEQKGIQLDSYDVGNTIIAEVDSAELEELAREEEVKTATPEMQYIAFVEESLPILGVTEAHSQNKTGQGKKIAILDTGIQASHPWFENTTIISANFIETDAQDHNGHGTHVAGIATRTAPGATILNAKVLDSKGGGTSQTILAGINWALNPDGNSSTNDGADIISLSLGTTQGKDEPIAQALQEATNRGVIVVAAAGNCRIGCGSFYGVTFPASMQEVIAVGAVDKNLQLANFSSSQDFGNYTKPDYVAPGVNILSAGLQGTSIDSGTSMATPFVSAQIAIIGGTPQATNKTLDYGHGIINLTLPVRIPEKNTTGIAEESGPGNSTPINTTKSYNAQTVLLYQGQKYKCSTEPDLSGTINSDKKYTPQYPAGLVVQLWEDNYNGEFLGEKTVWYGNSKWLSELFSNFVSGNTYQRDMYRCYTEWNCADTDGEDLFKIGHSTESCLNLYEVKEAICSGTSVTHTTWDCRDVGRSFCKQGTCREACSRDSDCPTDYKCDSGECVSAIACYNDGECGNDGWLNNKYCSGGDVWDTWRDYTCYNDGTSSSYCDHDDDRQQRTDCSPHYCNNGKCGTQETCNGQDDDYDGDTDEGNVCSCSNWGMDSCTSNGAKRRSGDNAQECKWTSRHDSHSILCWNTIATKGNGEFCEALPNGICNEHGDYDCDAYLTGGDNCGNGLICMGPPGDWSESDYDGCCNNGESWDTNNMVCLQADGTNCDNNNQCSGGYCLHNKCSSTPYIIGDGHCDAGEGCSNSPDDCGKCDGEWCSEPIPTSTTECAGKYCVWNTCRSTPTYCGDQHCDYPETSSSCPFDCYPDMRVIEITQAPSYADQGQTVTIKARIRNLGTVGDQLKLEAGIMPKQWGDDWGIWQYEASNYWDTAKCCPGNNYFDAVEISLGSNTSEIVTFTLKTPTYQSLDDCDKTLPKESAWSDHHRILVGLYRQCGGGYVDYDYQDIRISQKQCNNDKDCGTGGECVFDSSTESHCEYTPCENECDISNRYTCTNNVLYECKTDTSTGCTIKTQLHTCTAPKTCVNGLSTCQQPAHTFTVEDATPGTRVNKQVGDKITVHGTQITHSPGLELEGCTSDKCTLRVKSTGTHSISTSTQTEQVRAITPETIYITNKQKLKQAYGNNDDVKKFLNSVYTKASTNGIVYYLEDYLSTSHPWNYLGDYKENPLQTYITNDYALEASLFAREKCGDCENTIILGDDYVVPHYRREVDLSRWFGLSTTQGLIFTDTSYTPRTTKTFSEFEELFYQKERFDGKKVLIVQPDNLEQEEIHELNRLADFLENHAEIEARVSKKNASDVECNSNLAHTYYDGWTLITYGTEETNSALNCMPFINDPELEFVTIEKNPWDARAYAIIIHSNNATSIATLNAILESGQYKDLHSSNWLIVRTGSNVAAGAAIGALAIGTGGAAPAAMAIIAIGAGWASDGLDVAQCIKFQDGTCVEAAIGLILPGALDKIGVPVVKSMSRTIGPPLKHMFEVLGDSTLRFLKRIDKKGSLNPNFARSWRKIVETWDTTTIKSTLKDDWEVEHAIKGQEKLLKDGENLANFHPNLPEAHRIRLIFQKGRYDTLEKEAFDKYGEIWIPSEFSKGEFLFRGDRTYSFSGSSMTSVIRRMHAEVIPMDSHVKYGTFSPFIPTSKRIIEAARKAAKGEEIGKSSYILVINPRAKNTVDVDETLAMNYPDLLPFEEAEHVIVGHLNTQDIVGVIKGQITYDKYDKFQRFVPEEFISNSEYTPDPEMIFDAESAIDILRRER